MSSRTRRQPLGARAQKHRAARTTAISKRSSRRSPNASPACRGTDRRKVESMWAGLEQSRRSSQMSNNESTIVGDHTKTGRSVHTTAHKHITVCSARGQGEPFGPDHERATIWLSTAGWASATRLLRTRASHMLRGRRARAHGASGRTIRPQRSRLSSLHVRRSWSRAVDCCCPLLELVSYVAARDVCGRSFKILLMFLVFHTRDAALGRNSVEHTVA